MVVLLADTFLLLLLFLLVANKSTCTKLVVVRAAVVVLRTEAVALASQGRVVTISEEIMMRLVVNMVMVSKECFNMVHWRSKKRKNKKHIIGQKFSPAFVFA